MGKSKTISCCYPFIILRILREISTIIGRSPISYPLAIGSAPYPLSRILHRRGLQSCSTERRKTKRGSDRLGEESWNQQKGLSIFYYMYSLYFHYKHQPSQIHDMFINNKIISLSVIFVSACNYEYIF
jgi:hypothetical protein